MSEVLDKAYAAAPTDAAVLWRYGRVQYLLAKELPPDNKAGREALIRKGLEFCEKGLKAITEASDVNDKVGANKWMGIMFGSLGDYISTKEKIGNAYKIKEYFEQALKFKEDATVYHCLGVWCVGVYNIGWAERAIASAIFASPPTATFEDAERNLMKAFELYGPENKQVGNCLALAKLYYSASKYDQCKKFATMACKECEHKTADAKRDAAEAAALLAKC